MKRVIGFLKYRFIAITISLGLILVFTVVTFIKGGLKMGIDFAGGVKIIAKFEEGITETKIRDSLKEFNPMVQQIGSEDKNEYIISTKLKEEKKVKPKKKIDNSSVKKTGLKDKKTVKNVIKSKKVKEEPKIESDRVLSIRKKLAKDFNNVKFLSVENVGPAIGDFLKKSALKLFLIAIVLMVLYLTFRFEFKYSVGAIAALVHDILFCTVFCGLAGIEINIPVIAALLTTFGYSVNDTIVIFDRVRENVQFESKQTYIDLINKSVSQSLSRTLLTSLTTLFVVLALYLLGGKVLNDFALVLLVGIFVGTYSSIYIASPVLIAWEKYFSK
ncbi:protein translocase subunit SecF [Spirochaetota bacterium]